MNDVKYIIEISPGLFTCDFESGKDIRKLGVIPEEEDVSVTNVINGDVGMSRSAHYPTEEEWAKVKPFAGGEPQNEILTLTEEDANLIKLVLDVED